MKAPAELSEDTPLESLEAGKGYRLSVRLAPSGVTVRSLVCQGMDTASPRLELDGRTHEGTYEEILGTALIFSRTEEGVTPESTSKARYRLVFRLVESDDSL